MGKESENLLQEFLALGVDDRELGNSFTAYFGSASGGIPGNTQYIYRLLPGSFDDTKNDYKFMLKANAKGKLAGIYAGPSVSSEEVEKFKKVLISDYVADVGSIVRVDLLYCMSLVVRGSWRYRDLFQIRPIPSNAPSVKHTLAPNPFLLEFKIKNSPKWDVRLYRRYRKIKELRLLLNAFLEAHIVERYRSLTFTWGCVDEDGRTLDVKPIREGYKINGLSEEVSDFSTISNGIPIVPLKSYFPPFGGGGADYSLRIPDTLTEALDSFYALSQSKQEKFLTACYWLNQAEENKTAKSASYVFLVQAIEALIPEARQEVCSVCGQSKYKLSKRFRDFIEKYAPNDMWGSGRKRLYSIRSELSHGSRLLSVESGYTVTYDDDGAWHEMHQITKVAMMNWILSLRQKVGNGVRA